MKVETKANVQQVIVKPMSKGLNGRDLQGKFVKGHSISKCSRNVASKNKAAELKQALINCFTIQDIIAIGKKLKTEAKGGNLASIHEVFDRLFGKPKQELDIVSVLTLCDIAAQMAGEDDHSDSK